ncbi:MAG: hypothetical protein WAN43_12895 [Rhodomicrobium sp.]
MMTRGDRSRPPQPNRACLQTLAAAEVAAAYIGAQKGGCQKGEAVAALSEFFDAEPILAGAAAKGLIEERAGLFYAAANAHSPPLRSAAWADARRNLAYRALGVDPARGQRDLAAAALRQLFSLDNLPPAPSRSEVRCELLRRIVASFEAPFMAGCPAPSKAFSFDPMSRAIYLAFAGLGAGTVLQADARLLSSAFGGPAATVAELSATLVRAALKAPAAEAPKKEEAFNLDGFAESVRKLARRLETKPYSGRVAIAQVYDAGLAAGLELGTLDEFKVHLAEAAREGLVDLERYDITGPLDARLKERSRLRFGRDERHFIVNQWI